MQNPATMRAVPARGTVTAAVVLVAATMIALASRQAMATVDMAKTTGLPCKQCHTAPPALNSYGSKYKNELKK